MSGPIYIHYGHKAFDRGAFESVKNHPRCRNKPIGGLWASPVDAHLGWKDWCEREEFADCREENSFKFRLSAGAKVYHIYSKEDVERLPLQEDAILLSGLYPNFENIVDSGYDAIEYHLSSEKAVEDFKDGLYYVLYGWDCDSILVLDPDIVVPT